MFEWFLPLHVVSAWPRVKHFPGHWLVQQQTPPVSPHHTHLFRFKFIGWISSISQLNVSSQLITWNNRFRGGGGGGWDQWRLHLLLQKLEIRKSNSHRSPAHWFPLFFSSVITSHCLCSHHSRSTLINLRRCCHPPPPQPSPTEELN